MSQIQKQSSLANNLFQTRSMYSLTSWTQLSDADNVGFHEFLTRLQIFLTALIVPLKIYIVP